MRHTRFRKSTWGLLCLTNGFEKYVVDLFYTNLSQPRGVIENSLSVGDVESPGQDSESLSSPSSKPPLVDVTLSDWCITNLFPYFHNRKNH